MPFIYVAFTEPANKYVKRSFFQEETFLKTFLQINGDQLSIVVCSFFLGVIVPWENGSVEQ